MSNDTDEKMVIYDVRPLTVRFDKSKGTWLILRGSCPVKYHKGTKQEANQVRDELQLWPRVLAKFFLHLKPTSTERERKARALDQATQAMERRIR